MPTVAMNTDYVISCRNHATHGEGPPKSTAAAQARPGTGPGRLVAALSPAGDTETRPRQLRASNRRAV
jgi:hypothetical protein